MARSRDILTINSASEQMPFDMADMDSLPPYLRKYWPLVAECFTQMSEEEQEERQERRPNLGKLMEKAWEEAEKEGRKLEVSHGCLRRHSCICYLLDGRCWDVGSLAVRV